VPKSGVNRYYSGKTYSTWGFFSELSLVWGRKEHIPVRELGDNRILVEFDSERPWKRVIDGGPWRHKGDAVIFVPYDGIKRLSEVAITSIALWVRIYDIPISMMTEGFTRALGAKIGRVLDVGQAVNNYKRVRVDFPLEKIIPRSVHQKVRGHGELAFLVRYENIPDFWFGCGRIGHDQYECPDEELGNGGVHLCKTLRCSPQKKEVGKRMTIPAVDLGARHGFLNVCG
jgi:hypothetical protein